MDALKNLNPETLVVLGVLWILREIFGFVTKMNRVNRFDSAFVETMNRISEHIDAQTTIVKDLAYEIRSLTKDVARISADFEKIQRRGGSGSVRDRV
jgi:hypothetical protein